MRNTPDTTLRRQDFWLLTALVLISLAVRIPGVYSRAIWYDEAITLLETAGHADPTWSDTPTPSATQKELLVGSPALSEIAKGLRDTDVHPPFYYALLSRWRIVAGSSVEAARLFSVLISTASVMLLYLLLRSAGSALPFVPSLVYALSSGAVHYGHEARNYSLAMFLIIGGSFCAFLAADFAQKRTKFFWIFSLGMATSFGLALNTNYLSIFPILFLLTWFIAWLPRKRRITSVFSIILFSLIAAAILWVLPTQLGARPKQFQKALDFGDEIRKILDFNYSILWNPVHSSSGIQAAVLGTIVALGAVSFWYALTNWAEVDKRITSMMIGLAAAPSAGILALDLFFDKDLGKSSYVLFAGPAIVFLLTLATGFRQVGSDSSGARNNLPQRVLVTLVPLFIGLQLTGINFDLERTPGFAGSTIRSMAATIEASSPPPLVVIGAGHGRGDPASLVYELSPETTVCVVSSDSDLQKMRREIAEFDNIWFVFAKGRKSAAREDELIDRLVGDGGYRVRSRSKRLAHVRKRG